MRKSALMAGVMLLAVGAAPALALNAAPAAHDGASTGSFIRVATGPYSNMSYSLRSVQSILNDLGYNAGPVDGLMGSKTRAAITAFQVDRGLPRSGAPSYSLFQELQDAANEQFGADQPATPTPSVPSVSTNVVVAIQSELRKRGYDITALSGRIDTQTTAAIRAYQQDAGMTVTGRADEALLASLQTRPSTTPTYSRSDIAQVQKALSARGYDPGPADGVVGPRVRSAIRTFEADADMTVTGELSPTLLAKLGLSTGATAGTSTGSTGTGTSTGTVAPLTPEQRLTLEQDLAAIGYDVGRVDGFLEAKTEAAIRAYQESQDLTVDGKATTALLADVQGTKKNLMQAQAQQVFAVEQYLAQMGYAVGPIDGKLDTTTVAAIQAYQQKSGLDVTGRPSSSLVTHLEAGKGAPAVSVETVEAIEAHLEDKGYAVGPIDGEVDLTTQVAIQAFLRHNRLNLEPAPSDELLAAIRASNISAAQGQKADLIGTGINALTNIITRGVQPQE